MKLSAPPPPPPEPNEPGQPTPEENPGGNPPPTPAIDASAPASSAPATPTVTTTPATWPAWFAGADFVLALLAIVFAFLVASFVARNSDVWLHLATGKRLLSGEYAPGSDPFSYSAADRAWVNHSILFDAASYLLYSGNGSTLIAIKAVFVAAAFGLLIRLRRPGFAMWPWAMVAVVAVVASATYLQFRPVLASMFLLAVTLFLLFRLPHRANSMRFPAAIGVVFWLWANVDEWFFLGPLSLALVLIGELIRRAMQGAAPTAASPQSATSLAPEPEEPLGPLPDVPTLAKALGIGLLACMLNPHHVRVWQLPFELTGGKEVAVDMRFRQVLLSPLNSLYTSESGLGYNHNGLAYALLLVGGGVAVGLARRVNTAHVALWVGFAVLSLISIHAIPFLAMLAVPMIASQLNARSSGITLTTWGEPKTRFLLLGSGGGRVVSAIALLVGCAVAWPGWVHTPVGNASFIRRVGWGIEPDPAMAKAAGQLQAWREKQQLPPDARGLVASTEFANYCAWFAPLEKVFANGRFNHHRPEWHDYITVRVGLQLIKVDERPNPNDTLEVFRRTGSEYVAIHAGLGENQYSRVMYREATRVQWLDTDHWSPWYIDGRTTISGWRAAPGTEKPTFAALRLDPVVEAFGPSVERLPPSSVQQLRPPAGWEEAFVRAPVMTPAGFDEALMWWIYRHSGEEQYTQRRFAVQFAAYLTDRVLGMPVVSRAVPAPPQAETQRAAAFLALRAARRAIAETPHHPDPYFSLFQALDARELPIGEADRAIAQITALRQCLARFPAPEDYHPGFAVASPSRVAAMLAASYVGHNPERYGNTMAGVLVAAPVFGILTRIGATGFVVAEGNRMGRIPAAAVRPGQMQVVGGPFLLPLDVIRETVITAQNYAVVEIAKEEELKSFMSQLKDMQKAVEGELARSNNRFESRRATEKIPRQVELALENSLAGEALRLLTARDLDVGKEFGQTALDFMLCRVTLELVLGRLEDAAADLEALAADTGVQQRLADPTVRAVFNGLLYQKHLLEGNYAEAGRVMQDMEAARVGHDPNKPVREQFNPKPFVESKVSLRDWVAFSPLAGLGSATPFDLAARTCAPAAALGGYQYQRNQGDFVIVPGFWPLMEGLQNHREFRADFFYRRGVLFLLEGDIAEAEKRFMQTRLEAVKDWGLAEARHPQAELYLRLIEDARKRSAGK